MKIEKLKYRKLSIGDTVKVHDFEYLKNLYKEKMMGLMRLKHQLLELIMTELELF